MGKKKVNQYKLGVSLCIFQTIIVELKEFLNQTNISFGSRVGLEIVLRPMRRSQHYIIFSTVGESTLKTALVRLFLLFKVVK